MTAASDELMRALVEHAPDTIGRKKWRKLLLIVHRDLMEATPDNGVGPVVQARREAAQILRSAIRLAFAERR